MSNCKKDHSNINEIMDELPIEQGGVGRHKCAACAYEQGLSDGYSRKMQIDLHKILSSLETSQAGSQRHKSAHLGYIRGYYDGLLEYYHDANVFEDKEENITFYSDSGGYESMIVNEDNCLQYNKELVNETNMLNNNAEEMDVTDNNMDILDYKVSDLQNHTVYLFNDFDNKSIKGRTFNVLHAQGIITLQDVMDYKGNVMDLPGAGRRAKSDFEYLKNYIINLMKKYDTSKMEMYNNTINEPEQLKPTNLLSSLSKEKREMAEYDYKQKVSGLRSRNRKFWIFISRYSFEEFVCTFCYKPESELRRTRGLGGQKFHALISFRDEITEYLEQLSAKVFEPNEQKWELITRQIDINLQDDFKNTTGKELKDYYLANNHLPVFKLLDLLFYRFSSKSYYGSCFVQNYFSNSSDYDCISDDVTRTRRDQRADEVYNYLKNRNSKISYSDPVRFDCIYSFCYLLNSNEHIEYINQIFANKDIISESDINTILEEEKCLHLKSREALSFIGLAFNRLFYTQGGVFNDDPYEKVFLIRNELFDIYNFTTAILFFREKYESQHTTTYKIDIRDFVRDDFDFWNDGISRNEYVERITSVLSELIIGELGLGEHLIMDVLTLNPNSEVPPKEIIYETLKSIGKPSTPEEIFNALGERKTKAVSTVDNVKRYLTSDSRIVFTKFEGKYDLVSNKPDIGSYRDYIRIILNESEKPLSPQGIYDLLPDSRKLGFDKFSRNLAAFQEIRRYIGGLYGLNNKEYDSKYFLDIQNFTSGDKLAKISAFLSKNQRLPKASDGPEWGQLRNWWDSLSSRAETKFTEEEYNKYLDLKSRVVNPARNMQDEDFNNMGQQLKNFIINNHCMPSKNSEDNNESQLAKWFEKNFRKMLQEALNDEQTTIFIDLLKIKSKYAN